MHRGPQAPCDMLCFFTLLFFPEARLCLTMHSLLSVHAQQPQAKQAEGMDRKPLHRVGAPIGFKM